MFGLPDLVLSVFVSAQGEFRSGGTICPLYLSSRPEANSVKLIGSSHPAGSMSVNANVKPEIRLLHQMARTGGTLISRCLSAMDGVYLLSEIHPLTGESNPQNRRITQHMNPLTQAVKWFDLLTDDDKRHLQQHKSVVFVDCMLLISERVQQVGGYLVLRDWTHLDFTAVPYLPRPSYRLLAAEFLERAFNVHNTTVVRHPLDQWLSLSKLRIMQGNINANTFLKGYRRFANLAVDIGFVRYEDFVHRPDESLQTLCARLHLPFDPNYRERWAKHKRFTGHHSEWTEIRANPRRVVDSSVLRRFRANQHYLESTEVLGYEP